MADDRYQRTTAPRVSPAPLPPSNELEGWLAQLLRYRDGPNLVTLSADAVPAALACAFPLTTREWMHALQRRVVSEYWKPDRRGSDAVLTVIRPGGIYRGRGVLAEGEGDGWFAVLIDGAPFEDRHGSTPASHILSVTAIEDPPHPRPEDGYTLIPTLADACGNVHGVAVVAGAPGVLWHRDGATLRLSRGSLHHDGPIVTVSGEPFDDEPVDRGSVRAVDGAPARGWFWMTVVMDLQSQTGASLEVLTAAPDATADGARSVATRGTLVGFDLEPEVPVLLIEVPEPQGFTVRRVPLDTVGRMEVHPPRTEPGGFRRGMVQVGQLPPPEVARREALDRIREGGNYLLLWQLHPEAFTMLQLSDVHLVGDRIRGTRGDGLQLEVPFAEILAVQDPDATVQRRLAEKYAWWDLLPDLLAPLVGRRGTIVFVSDGVSSLREGVSYLGDGDEGFRFATSDGIQEVASDDLIAFEVDRPDTGGDQSR